MSGKVVKVKVVPCPAARVVSLGVVAYRRDEILEWVVISIVGYIGRLSAPNLEPIFISMSKGGQTYQYRSTSRADAVCWSGTTFQPCVSGSKGAESASPDAVPCSVIGDGRTPITSSRIDAYESAN